MPMASGRRLLRLSKWIAYDPDNGEIIVYTTEDDGKTFHSHVETWKQLRQPEEKSLLKNDAR